MGNAFDATKDYFARKCIIFDFDGTIADTAGFIIKAATETLIEWGMSEEERGDMNRVVGPPFPGVFTEIWGFSPEEDLKITTRYRELYDWKAPESHVIYEGVRELLADLVASGKRLAIASSKMQMKLDWTIEDLDIAQYFEAPVGKADDKEGRKPELIAEAIEAMGVTKDQCVMVGDRRYDVEGAKAIGIPCVGVTYGTHEHDELAAAGADLICESVEDLRRALLRSSE